MTAPLGPSTAGPATPSPYAYTPPRDDSAKVVMWARIVVTLILIPLGMSAFRANPLEYGGVPLLSDINVAIHEFGHNLFQPFGWAFLGWTAVVLGGSLTQVAFPSLFVGYFLFSRKNRDIHAAMVALFWVAINILEVSIYAGDARAGQLQLINGLTGQDEGSGHDFQYLFRQWNVMKYDTLYARRMRAFAALLFFLSVVVGLWAAWNKRNKNLDVRIVEE